MRLMISLVLLMTLTASAEVKLVRVPDDGIAPQAAVDDKGVVHLIYFKGEAKAGDIYYTTSTDGGASFAKAIRVNSEPSSSLVAGTIRGPHLALGRNGRPHVAWMGSHPAKPKAPGNETPMLYTRLGDDGRFEPQRNVIAKQVGMDGGGSVAADGDGNVYVAWHAPETKGGNEASRKLWIARSTDDGKTFEVERDASGDIEGACACCSVRIMAGHRGEVLALYRRATNMTERGTVYVHSSDGTTFTAKPLDQMNSGKCIMSSYAMAKTRNGYAFAAENNGQVTVARSGKIFQLSPIGAGKHPAVAVNGEDDLLVVRAVGTGWNKGGTIEWQVVAPDGKPRGNGEAKGLPPWSVPTAFALPGGDFVVIY